MDLAPTLLASITPQRPAASAADPPGDAQALESNGFDALFAALAPASETPPAGVLGGAVPLAPAAAPPSARGADLPGAGQDLAAVLLGGVPPGARGSMADRGDSAGRRSLAGAAPAADPAPGGAATLAGLGHAAHGNGSTRPDMHALTTLLARQRADAGPAAALAESAPDRALVPENLPPGTEPAPPSLARGIATDVPAQAAKGAPLPVAEPAVFAERLGQHLSVMISQHAQHARIAVSPPDLGPVEVRVTVVGEEASVQLVSAHAATRDALEEALPRLRAMFADSGLVLDQAGVFSETPQRGGRAAASYAEAGATGGDGEVEDDGATAVAGRVKVSLGLVDAYV